MATGWSKSVMYGIKDGSKKIKKRNDEYYYVILFSI